MRFVSARSGLALLLLCLQADAAIIVTAPAEGGGSEGFTPESGYSLSGTLGDGNSVTLTKSGGGFGSTGVPLAYDDFEWGSDGDNINLSPNASWSTSNSNGPPDPEIDTSRSFSGTRAGYFDAITASGDSLTYLTGVNSTTAYVSLWFYYNLSGTPTTQKGVRVHAGDGPHEFTSYPGIYVQDFNTNNRISINWNDDDSDSPASPSMSNIAEDTWIRTDYWFQHSDPATANGTIQAWHDLSQVANITSQITRTSGVTDVIQYVLLPFYFSSGGGGEAWYDEVYISTTKARLEICDNAVFASATKCAVQEPTSWADGSITFNLRYSNFTTEEKHLFWIDSSGTATKTGEIT